ncbi:cyclase family protein [Flavisphingomonas formosensis]|uniref:cyclase family protein n=1 Tax=Flavisphingomonas formosensis TaxID=861534 RepID=UPI0012F95F17|nr:cyclase family protein [Sphingomonas formosensis]
MNAGGPRWKNRPEGSNWGDYGPDDQLGRMNLITPERRRAGLAEAREGICFSLSLPLDYPGGTLLSGGVRQPPKLFAPEFADGLYPYNVGYEELPSRDISCDDAVVIYSQYSTQWDSFAHWGGLFDADGDGVPEKVYYNGYRAGEHLVGPAEGGPYARALGMEHLAATGVQGRGVLLDLVGQPSWVDYDALMRAIEAQRVDIRAGDMLCLHSGADKLILSMNRDPDKPRVLASPGLDGRDQRLLRWIDESGIAALCSDTPAVEQTDFVGTDGDPHDHTLLPLHELCLFKLGIHLGEMWHFAELKAWLQAHGRTAFLLTAPPWRLPGSVGSPVNPVATV